MKPQGRMLKGKINSNFLKNSNGNQLLHPSPQNKDKQHATASTSPKQVFRSAGAGLKLWGWPYPVVPSPKPGFQLRAAPELCAAVAPTRGWGYHPNMGTNGPKMAINTHARVQLSNALLSTWRIATLAFSVLLRRMECTERARTLAPTTCVGIQCTLLRQ